MCLLFNHAHIIPIFFRLGVRLWARKLRLGVTKFSWNHEDIVRLKFWDCFIVFFRFFYHWRICRYFVFLRLEYMDILFCKQTLKKSKKIQWQKNLKKYQFISSKGSIKVHFNCENRLKYTIVEITYSIKLLLTKCITMRRGRTYSLSVRGH